MKNRYALLAVLAALTLQSSATAANALTVSCQVHEKIHQTTDLRRQLPAYNLTYTISNRGWKTPVLTGWFKTGIIVQRYDSITGTQESYAIPNNDTHFVKAPGGNRGYITADGLRQFTFSDKYTHISDRDVTLNRTFIGSCVKQQKAHKFF